MSDRGISASPLDLPYIKQIVFSLSKIGGWPYKEFGIKKKINPFFNHKYIFMLWVFLFVTGALYVKNRFGVISFFELGHTYITVFLNVNCTFRFTLPWSRDYRLVMKDFIQKFHLLHFKDSSEFSTKIYNKIDKYCSIFTTFLHMQMCIGIVFFNVSPLVKNYNTGMFDKPKANGTYEHAVYYELPFDYSTNFFGYVALFLANIPISYQCTVAVCMYDLLISIMVFHVWGHLKILKQNLANFMEPHTIVREGLEYVYYEAEVTELVTRELHKNINHHKFVKDFSSKMIAAFTPTLCLYMLFHQVCLCILFLECSKLDLESISRYGPLTLILVQQLIQISYVFDLMSSVSDTLKIDVYNLPWESMDKKNKKFVLFFLQSTQSPLNLKAYGIVIGVQTMTTILKNSFSYFLMLRTLD